MLTGQTPQHHGLFSNTGIPYLPLEHTLPEEMRRGGYQTAMYRNQSGTEGKTQESKGTVGNSAPLKGRANAPIEESVPEPEPNPFTPSGTGTVVDNATDEGGKEFFTITPPAENVFYLVIDRQRGTENVYFLNAVTEADLLALAEQTGAPPAGAGRGDHRRGGPVYFKVYRPKHQKAAEPEQDYETEYDDYDGEDDAPPWDEDGDAGEEDEA